MKGFKDKSGKFRPTGKRSKSSLSKMDIKKNNLSEKDITKLNDFVSRGHEEDFVLRHFISEVEPINGFEFKRYPPLNDEDEGSLIESTDYMQLEKGDRDSDYYVELTLKSIDARIRGKPYRIDAYIVKDGRGDYINLEAGSYDDAVDELKKLMRLL